MGRQRACVAAVQWMRRRYSSLEDLAVSLEEPLQEAAQAGAELVAFPDGVGEALAGVLAGAELDAFAAWQALGNELAVRFEDLGRSLAETYRVTLALGPVLAGSTAGPERVSCIFGPEGDVLGIQAQTHRSPAERAAGLVRGTVLAPIETLVGPVGLVNGADIEYPEVSRILCLQGAVLLVHQACLERFNETVALSHLWREVQANQVFGIEAYGVGQGWYGRSAIHAPVELVTDQSGWLARAPDDEWPAVVTGDLDLSRLRQLRQAYPIYGLRNVAQYQRYFPVIYESGGGKAEDGAS